MTAKAVCNCPSVGRGDAQMRQSEPCGSVSEMAVPGRRGQHMFRHVLAEAVIRISPSAGMWACVVGVCASSSGYMLTRRVGHRPRRVYPHVSQTGRDYRCGVCVPDIISRGVLMLAVWPAKGLHICTHVCYSECRGVRRHSGICRYMRGYDQVLAH